MSLDTDIEILKRVSLFSDFKPGQLRLLAFGCEARTLDAGTELFKQGTYSDGGYVVVWGSVDLVTVPDQKTISSHNSAALLGELALITETEHPATAVTTQRTQVLKIPRALFRRMLEEYPDLASILQKRIAQSMHDFVNRLDIIRAKLDRAESLATHKTAATEV